MSNYLYDWLDMAKKAELTDIAIAPNYDTNQTVLSDRVNQLIKAAGYTNSTFSFIDDATYGQYIKNLVNNLINRWLVEDVYLAVGETEEPTIEKVNQFSKKILDKISKNYISFCKRLAAQDKYLTDISNIVTVTSAGETRHNDTPNTDNNYSADCYTSDITKNSNTTTTSIDAVERYQQILLTIDNIYNEWLLTFKELEIYGEY